MGAWHAFQDNWHIIGLNQTWTDTIQGTSRNPTQEAPQLSSLTTHYSTTDISSVY
jgi:hypothetical protein